jgi:hypothetical protein
MAAEQGVATLVWACCCCCLVVVAVVEKRIQSLATAPDRVRDGRGCGLLLLVLQDRQWLLVVVVVCEWHRAVCVELVVCQTQCEWHHAVYLELLFRCAAEPQPWHVSTMDARHPCSMSKGCCGWMRWLVDVALHVQPQSLAVHCEVQWQCIFWSNARLADEAACILSLCWKTPSQHAALRVSRWHAMM